MPARTLHPRLPTRTLVLGGALAFASIAIAQPPPPPPPPGAQPCGAAPVAPAPEPGAAPVQVPALDVVSVKPDKTNGGMMRLMFTGDGLSVTNVPVHMLLTESYALNDDQILAEPAWAKADRFDVEAKVAGPDVATLSKLTFDQRRSMFRQVLAERFQLAAHHETESCPSTSSPFKRAVKNLARSSQTRLIPVLDEAPNSPLDGAS